MTLIQWKELTYCNTPLAKSLVFKRACYHNNVPITGTTNDWTRDLIEELKATLSEELVVTYETTYGKRYRKVQVSIDYILL